MSGTSTYTLPLQQGYEEQSYMYSNGDNSGIKWINCKCRALTILGELAHLHEFGIVVDEIMTSGHTKTMLSTMETPKIFQKSVEFITMGKWLKCRMVLGSKRQQTIQSNLLSKQRPHGASTGINGNEA